MAVALRIPTILRPLAGGLSVVEAEGGTVKEVFADLTSRHPELAGRIYAPDGGLHRFLNVFVDDEDIRYLDGLDTSVPDGADISILPAVAGG